MGNYTGSDKTLGCTVPSCLIDDLVAVSNSTLLSMVLPISFKLWSGNSSQQTDTGKRLPDAPVSSLNLTCEEIQLCSLNIHW